MGDIERERKSLLTPADKTTDHDLLARIDKEISSITNRKTFLKGKIDNYEGNEQNHRREINRLNKELSTWKALRAVVELPDRDPRFNINSSQVDYSKGYDQALVDVKQAIEKELG